MKVQSNFLSFRKPRLCRKKMDKAEALFSSSFQKNLLASLTIEAAFSLSLFLFAIIILMTPLFILNREIRISREMEKNAPGNPHQPGNGEERQNPLYGQISGTLWIEKNRYRGYRAHRSDSGNFGNRTGRHPSPEYYSHGGNGKHSKLSLPYYRRRYLSELTVRRTHTLRTSTKEEHETGNRCP